MDRSRSARDRFRATIHPVVDRRPVSHRENGISRVAAGNEVFRGMNECGTEASVRSSEIDQARRRSRADFNRPCDRRRRRRRAWEFGADSDSRLRGISKTWNKRGETLRTAMTARGWAAGNCGKINGLKGAWQRRRYIPCSDLHYTGWPTQMKSLRIV